MKQEGCHSSIAHRIFFLFVFLVFFPAAVGGSELQLPVLIESLKHRIKHSVKSSVEPGDMDIENALDRMCELTDPKDLEGLFEIHFALALLHRAEGNELAVDFQNALDCAKHSPKNFFRLTDDLGTLGMQGYINPFSLAIQNSVKNVTDIYSQFPLIPLLFDFSPQVGTMIAETKEYANRQVPDTRVVFQFAELFRGITNEAVKALTDRLEITPSLRAKVDEIADLVHRGRIDDAKRASSEIGLPPSMGANYLSLPQLVRILSEEDIDWFVAVNQAQTSTSVIVVGSSGKTLSYLIEEPALLSSEVRLYNYLLRLPEMTGKPPARLEVEQYRYQGFMKLNIQGLRVGRLKNGCYFEESCHLSQ